MKTKTFDCVAMKHDAQDKSRAKYGALPWPERTLFSVDSVMDLGTVAEAFGETHIIAGNVPTMLLENGPFQEVYRETRRCIEIGKTLPGGFVLMPACELPVGCPHLNVAVMVQAARDFGGLE